MGGEDPTRKWRGGKGVEGDESEKKKKTTPCYYENATVFSTWERDEEMRVRRCVRVFKSGEMDVNYENATNFFGMPKVPFFSTSSRMWPYWIDR